MNKYDGLGFAIIPLYWRLGWLERNLNDGWLISFGPFRLAWMKNVGP